MKFFDAHFHIIDPKFPLVKNQGYLPPPFTVHEYKQWLHGMDLVGGAVVSGSFQAFDQGYLCHALKRLGDSYFGVANIPMDMTDEEINRLDLAGVKAVRFNLKRGGSESIKHLNFLSNKLYLEYGWHTELYLDSKNLSELAPTLELLPAYSIDHLGLSKAGLRALYQLVENGARVKATGFGRLEFDAVPVMQQIMRINPEALMFGTDLPSTRSKVPFSMKDVALVRQNFSNSDQEKIFSANALKWYGK